MEIWTPFTPAAYVDLLRCLCHDNLHAPGCLGFPWSFPGLGVMTGRFHIKTLLPPLLAS